MKTRSELSPAERPSRAAAQRETAHGSAAAAASHPREAAQRRRLDGVFGPAIQRVAEEDLLQGRFATTQRVEEEEPLQGRFATAQRVEEEDLLQGRFATAQRVEDEEPLQGRFAAALHAGHAGHAAQAPLQRREADTAPVNKTGLPDALKAGVESLSGLSLDHVKVHYNSAQPAQLNALAYAQGADIHVAPGQEQHLPHEAWHIVQQAQGRVRPTTQMKGGVAVNDDVALETEADVMGAKALSAGAQVQMKAREATSRAPASTTAQRACAACELDAAPAQRASVAQAVVVQRVDIPTCEGIHNGYKALGNPESCKPGDSGAEGLRKKNLLTSIIAGRGNYLAQDCDAILPGSIARGTDIARAGHQQQLDQIRNMLRKCP